MLSGAASHSPPRRAHQAHTSCSEPPEAEQPLEFIARGRERDPMIEAFENAPLDDEPVTKEEELALDEARDAIRRGDTYTLDEIRRELG